MNKTPGTPAGPAVDWAGLYDAHPEYAARRDAGSWERALVDLEVRAFKLPNLQAVLAGDGARSLLEIGCATGELVAGFPVEAGGRRLGIDISPQNIVAARERFPGCAFEHGDFADLPDRQFDVVLLSDVLEHVPDDLGFLAAAAAKGRRVLVNLPLECNWLNRGRAYGPDDVSGHLRAYDLAQGLGLIRQAGLELVRWQRVWIHETAAEAERRRLRAARFGQAYAGGWFGRPLRAGVFRAATAVRPLGRRLFASNLFALARTPDPA